MKERISFERPNHQIASRPAAIRLEFVPSVLPSFPATGTLHDRKAALLKSRPSHRDPPWLGTARIAGYLLTSNAPRVEIRCAKAPQFSDSHGAYLTLAGESLRVSREILASTISWAIYGAVREWFYSAKRKSAEQIAPSVAKLILPLVSETSLVALNRAISPNSAKGRKKSTFKKR